MKLDGELVNLLSISFRIMFLGCIFIGISWGMIEALLGKCRHPRVFVSYLLGKQFLTGVVINVILGHYYGQTDEWVALDALVMLIVLFLDFGVFTYSFQGGFVKVCLCIGGVEIFCYGCFFPWLFFVNWLEGREIFGYGVPFRAMDLMMVILSGATMALFYRLSVSWLRRFREYQIRHTKILGAIILLYTIGIQRWPFTDFDDEQSILFFHYFYLCCIGIIVASVLLVYCGYRRNVLKRRSFLTMRQQLMESHYQAVREQIMGMEHSQRIIGDQMREIIRMEPNAAGDGRIEEYLSHLKREYQEIRAGMYCDDWMIDAVLCCQAERARKAGIRVQYNMQGFDRGRIEEEDLVRLLFGLLDWGLKQNEKTENRAETKDEKTSLSENMAGICLRFSVVGNRLLLIFETDTSAKTWPKKFIRQIGKKYDVEMGAERIETGMRIVVGLTRE